MMKARNTTGLAGLTMAAALAAAVPHAAQAQGSSDGWQFEAAIYGWFPGISGTTSFPPSGNGPSIDVSMGDVIDALKFAFMGTLQARHGQWGVYTDLVYADFGASASRSRDITIGGRPLPQGVTADASLDVKSWIWTLAGLYNLKNDAEGVTDLLFGVRLLDMTNTLDWTFSANIPPYPSRSGTGKASITDWDAVVGLKGRVRFGEERKWFVPYYADVGTGESKLTWQLQAGLGYQFDWGSVLATWRYLDYDFKDSSKVQSLSMSGPTIGVTFKF
jgi:hypothetical protein